ncbi:major facilitator superfamily transporter [Lasiosphaeria hispida]|uniref:Major facilitator superfamily transporter n=1 Tax=Lasiosphaeria hispida TaxID=260671 RepID=A0AAJ0HDM6_9PEZI|nr:major facilitator superfamily transporter [Lasiosphaeria hispida]
MLYAPPTADFDAVVAVPGTVHLVDVGGQQASTKSRNGIELIPRPSDDPDDPLNWSDSRKRLSALMVVVYTVGIGMPLTLQYSVLADITHDTGISTASLVEGTGFMFLLLGLGCLFWQPIAQTYGRRGVYLGSTLGCVPLMVWTAYSKSAGEWYAHRILAGFFAAPIESLPEISIPDVFFAHDRGAWMSLYVFALFGSNFLAPLCAGWLAEACGWRWTMQFGAIMCAVTFLILFFGMEETMYFRKTLEGLEHGPGVEEGEEGKNNGDRVSSSGAVYVPRRKRGFPQRLGFFVFVEGRPSVRAMFRSMWLPLPIIARFPNVAWAGFIYGINLCWYNVLNATASPILSSAPYGWSTGLVGCIYIGPIIGTAFGCLWAGLVADRITLWLARRNNGIREPEQRLWTLGLSAVMSCAGLVVWGVGATRSIHWAGLAAGLGMLTFGVVTGGCVALSYNVDCFKEISGHSTTSVILIRNVMGFAVSYAITPWYMSDMGLQGCFVMAGFLSLGCTCTFLFMVWKGKTLRTWSAPKYWEGGDC